MKEIILIGGGGHCKACIEVIQSQAKFHIAGIVDAPAQRHQSVLGYKIIAADKDLPQVIKKNKDFLIAMGSIKDPAKRVAIFDYLKRLGARFPVIISKRAHVAKSAEVAEGTVIMHDALVNAAARIGRNCIVNTKALVEHDVQVGDHCHLSTASVLNGKCRLGNRVFIGSNSVVVNDVEIGDDVVIGAGAVVTQSIKQSGVYVGNPARRVTKKTGKK